MALDQLLEFVIKAGARVVLEDMRVLVVLVVEEIALPLVVLGQVVRVVAGLVVLLILLAVAVAV